MFLLFLLASCFPLLAVDGSSRSNHGASGGSGGGPSPPRKGKAVKNEEEEEEDIKRCTVCLEPLEGTSNRRTVVNLQCWHTFHLDCIGSAFNMKGRMECPICRGQEEGQWRYASGGAAADRMDENSETGRYSQFVASLERITAMILERATPNANDDPNSVRGDAADLNRPSVARYSSAQGVQFEPVNLRPQAPSDTRRSNMAPHHQSSHLPEPMYGQALRASPYASPNIHSFGPRASDSYGSQMAPAHFSASYPQANHGYMYSGYPYAYAPVDQQNHMNYPELTSRITHSGGSHTEGVQTTRGSGGSTFYPRRPYQVPPLPYMPINVNTAQPAPHLATPASSSSIITRDQNYQDSAGPSTEGGSVESPPGTQNVQ